MSTLSSPITLTPTAYNRIEDIRSSRGQPGLFLRLAVSGGGCSGFRYDFSWDETASEGDFIVEDVLLIDPMSAAYVLGATLDYSVSLMGEQFKVTNPNAASGCGCGESFSV